MSRSGYCDDGDYGQWEMIMWRGAVTSAFRGKRGQAFLKEMLDAMDAMEAKRLIANQLATEGDACAIGTVGKKRGIDMSRMDPEDAESVAHVFGIAPSMAREIVYMNDERCWNYQERRAETPEERFVRMRKWIEYEILSHQFQDMRKAIRKAHHVR